MSGPPQAHPRGSAGPTSPSSRCRCVGGHALDERRGEPALDDVRGQPESDQPGRGERDVECCVAVAHARRHLVGQGPQQRRAPPPGRAPRRPGSARAAAVRSRGRRGPARRRRPRVTPGRAMPAPPPRSARRRDRPAGPSCRRRCAPTARGRR